MNEQRQYFHTLSFSYVSTNNSIKYSKDLAQTEHISDSIELNAIRDGGNQHCNFQSLYSLLWYALCRCIYCIFFTEFIVVIPFVLRKKTFSFLSLSHFLSISFFSRNTCNITQYLFLVSAANFFFDVSCSVSDYLCVVCIHWQVFRNI